MTTLTAGLQSFVPNLVLSDVRNYYHDIGDDTAADNIQQTLAESQALHAFRHDIHQTPIAKSALAPVDSPVAQDLRDGVMDRFTYDCQETTILYGAPLIIKEGQDPDAVTKDKVAINVHKVAGWLDGHLQKRFGRNSLDGKGKDIHQYVNYGRDYNNAANTGQLSFYGNGDGKIFHLFGMDFDVIVHELWHEITSTNAGADKKGLNKLAGKLFNAIRYGGWIYRGQSGAANESWSDVMCKVALWELCSEIQGKELKFDELPADFWRLGATCMVGNNIDGTKSSIRHFDNIPGYDREDIKRDRQVKDMRDYYTGSKDNYGVHINSGILNHAFFLACKAYKGYAPATLGVLYYQAQRLMHDSVTFKEVAAGLLETSSQLFGAHPEVRAALEQAFTAVHVIGPEATLVDSIFEIAANNRVRVFDEVDLQESPGRYEASKEGGKNIWTIGRPVDAQEAKAVRKTIKANARYFKNLAGFERASVGVKNGKLVVLMYVDSSAAGVHWPKTVNGYEVVPVKSDGANGFNLI